MTRDLFCYFEWLHLVNKSDSIFCLWFALYCDCLWSYICYFTKYFCVSPLAPEQSYGESSYGHLASMVSFNTISQNTSRYHFIKIVGKTDFHIFQLTTSYTMCILMGHAVNISAMPHEHHGILSHWPINCLFNNVSITKKISKIHITGPLWSGSTGDWWILFTRGKHLHVITSVWL